MTHLDVWHRVCALIGTRARKSFVPHSLGLCECDSRYRSVRPFAVFGCWQWPRCFGWCVCVCVCVCVTWLNHMCDMAQWLGHDSFPHIAHSQPSMPRECRPQTSFLRDMTHFHVTWLIPMCDMTHWLWHDAFPRVTLQILSLQCHAITGLGPHSLWHDSSLCDSSGRVSWLIRVCDMTHSCVWHDSFLCVTWLIPLWVILTCDMTHSHVWHDLFLCDSFLCTKNVSFSHVTWLTLICTWLIPICVMTHSQPSMWRESAHHCMWHDSFPCVTCLIFMCDMTHSIVWYRIFPAFNVERIQTSWPFCNMLQHAATCYNTLQHTATYCNTLQHTRESRPLTSVWHDSSPACHDSLSVIWPTCDMIYWLWYDSSPRVTRGVTHSMWLYSFKWTLHVALWDGFG